MPHPLRRGVSPWAVFVCTSLAVPAQALDVEDYVRRVLRTHPGARQSAALEAAAAAERTAARLVPDPVFEYGRGRARPEADSGPRATEESFAVTQTLPWPGTLAAQARAGTRAAEGLRAESVEVLWELEIEARLAFVRVVEARASVDRARAAEDDAEALRALVATRAELGESREADRLKAEIEWRREQRARQAAEREAQAAEAGLRALAGEPLPEPLVLEIEPTAPSVAPDAGALRAQLGSANPRVLAARASAERDAALASAARRARVPDLDVTWFRERELDKDGSGVRLGLRLPLWSGNRGAIARAEAAAALAGAAADRTLLEMTVRLEHARLELESAAAQVETLERDVLPAAARGLELARFSYQEGEISLLELLEARRSAREAQAEAAAARLERAVARAALQRLVGPDFEGRTR